MSLNGGPMAMDAAMDAEHYKRAAQEIFKTTPGGMWLPDPAAMYAAPDGAALAGSGVGTGLLMDASKAVAGYHAIQATEANRPMRLVTPQTGRNIFVPSGTQVLTATMNLGSCTVLRWRPDGTTDVTTETINGAFNVTELNRVYCGCAVVQGTLKSDQEYVLRQLFGWYRPGLGAELLTNGGFSNGTTGWTYVAPVLFSVTNGVATLARNGGVYANQPSQQITGLASKIINVSVTISAITGTMRIVAGPTVTLSAATGTTSIAIQASDGKFMVAMTASGVSTFDNVSVREII